MSVIVVDVMCGPDAEQLRFYARGPSVGELNEPVGDRNLTAGRTAVALGATISLFKIRRCGRSRKYD